MKININKNWVHGLIWLLMIIFFVFFPPVYAKFHSKQGIPVQIEYDFLQQTEDVEYAVDGLDTIVYDGENLYRFWGWAFQTKDLSEKQSDYERILVIRSNSNIYFFPLTAMPSQDIQVAYKGLNMDLTNVRYSAFIAKDFIAPGIYSVEIIFKHRINGTSFYRKTDVKMIRTPNRLVIKQ